MEAAIDEVKGVLPTSVTDDKKRWYAVKFLENDEKVKEAMKLSASGQSLVDTKRQELEDTNLSRRASTQLLRKQKIN